MLFIHEVERLQLEKKQVPIVWDTLQYLPHCIHSTRAEVRFPPSVILNVLGLSQCHIRHVTAQSTESRVDGLGAGRTRG